MICWFGTKNGKEFTGCLCASEFDKKKKKKRLLGCLKTTLSDRKFDYQFASLDSVPERTD